MIRTLTARRLAAGAAYGGGGVGLAGAALVAILREEARSARRKVEARNLKQDPPSGDGLYGRGGGTPIVLTVLGDSSAVGLGVHRAAETPGVLVAAGLAELAERPVRLVRLARSGARAADLDEQVDRALAERPTVAVIMIGANDVTARTPTSVSVGHLTEAVRRLTAAGCEVVVGTCPDLGTIRPIAQPLRTLARRWSRQMAAAQTIAVVEAGGRTVSLGSLLGPAFASDSTMFSVDEFHPSAAGYAAAAAVLLPSVADALGVWPAAADRRLRALRRDTARPVARAAARAVNRPGTEVQPAEVAGSETGPWGPWALLRRRRPTEMPTPDEAEHAGDGSGSPLPGRSG
ncbi:SGNH/GDSL hydrolase family protein [Blastococcus sp. MG754426]|uniref:SGNH/GDSL hydrolase family protein n=1 Tax=unclassified Blastococcus TaxID=2619396 RepID=UPI001EF09BEE|nr:MULTISPECIES: SGNH/GDSL hydrolase family protein [unclassified Blastococcus]MCF6508784.1 SGNH/GDSL hydrolase family protein [Blastococcus sp. MG754426]MCF6513422.1 SGNH/GDSL hydrolase family protein [Blastococcus sp. MG754427]MCF6736066.1 SGNH/GDSL hydrolase family protein [Blastococcus sp. KM273129]